MGISLKLNNMRGWLGLIALVLVSSPLHASVEQQRQLLNQVNQCQQFNQVIQSFCVDSPLLSQAQASTGVISNQIDLTDAGQTGPAEPQLQRGLNEGIANRTAVQQAQQICQEAANKCNNTCQQEMIQARSTTPPQEQLAEQHNQVNQMCRQQYEQMQQTSQMALADIAALIASIAQLMQALGIGGSDDPGLAEVKEKSDDPCEGQFADMLIECTGQSGPDSARAGLSGATGVGTNTGGVNDGLYNISEQGEPGGDRSGANNNRGGGGPGMMGAGFGGGGMMGAGLGGAGSGSDGSGSGSGLDSDIHRGFMGGGGGGGSSGGGGAMGRAAPALNPFGKSGLSGDELAKAQLESKINKLAKGQGARAPASTDGKNGPFQDNWSVVTQAYKKNSSTMFHQK
jgi:hypothetical protein